MPIYESETTTREELEKIRRWSKCKECGARLNIYLARDSGLAFLACWDYLRTKHDGIEREASRYEQEGLGALNIQARRKIMTQEHGEEKTKALSRYIGAGVITRDIATEIVETLWGDAPQIEKTKAIILCQSYQLNPLMRHLYLVGYKQWKNGKLVVDADGEPILTWSMMIGIGATRLQAQRKHNYSYLDMTPRKATKEEIDKILGDTADPNSIYGFVHVKDIDTGAEAFGLRGCSKNEKIKNEEKGNSHLNMACVRAERLALDRQYPGEMPTGVEVIDERFEEAVGADYTVVDEVTGEITEPEPERVEPQVEEAPPFISELEPEPELVIVCKGGCGRTTEGMTMGNRVGEFKQVDESLVPEWTCPDCLAKKDEPKREKPSPSPEKNPDRKITRAEIAELDKVMAKAHWDNIRLSKYVNEEKGWNVKDKKDISLSQYEETIKYIKATIGE